LPGGGVSGGGSFGNQSKYDGISTIVSHAQQDFDPRWLLLVVWFHHGDLYRKPGSSFDPRSDLGSLPSETCIVVYHSAVPPKRNGGMMMKNARRSSRALALEQQESGPQCHKPNRRMCRCRRPQKQRFSAAAAPFSSSHFFSNFDTYTK
jgi:hypothetical protein